MVEAVTGAMQKTVGAVRSPMGAVAEVGRSVASTVSMPIGAVPEGRGVNANILPAASPTDRVGREVLLRENILPKQENASGPLLAEQLESFLTNDSPHNALEFLAQGKVSSPEDSEKSPTSKQEKPVKSDRESHRNQLSKQELDIIAKGSMFSKKEVKKMTYEAIVSFIRMKMLLLRQQVMVDPQLSPEQKQKAIRRINLREKKLLLYEVIKHEGLSLGRVIAVVAIWVQELLLG